MKIISNNANLLTLDCTIAASVAAMLLHSLFFSRLIFVNNIEIIDREISVPYVVWNLTIRC